MARECLDEKTLCPRIRAILSDMGFNNAISGPGPIHPDTIANQTNGDRLVEAARDSYDCPGPRQVTVLVEKRIGFLGLGGTKTVRETRWVCGLDSRE